jgi:hypothetical protein
MGRSEECYESANNTSFDDLFDGWVSLLGEEFAELGCSLDLEIDLLGEDAFDHLWEVLVQLEQQTYVSKLYILSIETNLEILFSGGAVARAFMVEVVTVSSNGPSDWPDTTPTK